MYSWYVGFFFMFVKNVVKEITWLKIVFHLLEFYDTFS